MFTGLEFAFIAVSGLMVGILIGVCVGYYICLRDRRTANTSQVTTEQQPVEVQDDDTQDAKTTGYWQAEDKPC